VLRVVGKEISHATVVVIDEGVDIVVSIGIRGHERHADYLTGIVDALSPADRASERTKVLRRVAGWIVKEGMFRYFWTTVSARYLRVSGYLSRVIDVCSPRVGIETGDLAHTAIGTIVDERIRTAPVDA